MGQRLKLFVIVLTMLFVPIILNIVLGSCNPLDCIDVVGDPRDWLGFYGSYMGGCLTALIGFITLARDEKSNKLQIQISHKEHYVKELEGDFSSVTDGTTIDLVLGASDIDHE